MAESTAAKTEERLMGEMEMLIRARYPILYLVTWEEQRVERELLEVAKRLGKNAYCWTASRGLTPAGSSVQSKRSLLSGATDPMSALKEVLERVDPAIFLFKDFHPYLSNPEVVRSLRDLAEHLRNSPKTLILVSPKLQIPIELEKSVCVLDVPLPDPAQLGKFLDDLILDLEARGNIQVELNAAAKERLIKGLMGLTLDEAENVFAKAIVARSALDEGALPSVLAEKRQIIRKAGILEFMECGDGMEKVGGLKALKHWFKRRQNAFTEKASKFGLPLPKGVLLLGVQGCGKSLCAKTISAAWQQPLLRLDVSKIFSSLVGSSESNIREAVKIAESVAPAILWVDEIEKAFAGVQSSAFSDSGTTARVFGGFITWLQEKKSPVFVIATANSVSHLPPELMRKGRFDEIFFVDLPDQNERKEILAIHLKDRGRNPADFDLEALAALMQGFSGAEIEQAVVAGLYDAFDGSGDLTNDDIAMAVSQTVPLSRTMSEQLEQMRAWAKGRARPAA